jgi:hypothetical protein
MKSGWFFGTPMWNEYLQEYAKTRPECLREWKSSPLADDHDYIEWILRKTDDWKFERHQSQVIDLRTHKWSDIRKSYHSLIHKAQGLYDYGICSPSIIYSYRAVHAMANGGQPRNDATYEHQKKWIESGYGVLFGVWDEKQWHSFVYWIVYQGRAYYASSPSLTKNITHMAIWQSLEYLKSKGVDLVEIGQIDGETEKERNIGKFKTGFGGEAKPFTIVRRTS